MIIHLNYNCTHFDYIGHSSVKEQDFEKMFEGTFKITNGKFFVFINIKKLLSYLYSSLHTLK